MNMKQRWIAWIALTAWAVCWLPVFAQDTTAATTAIQTTTLWGLIKQGGWIMFPLGGLSVAMVGLAVYGFMAVREDKLLRLELLPTLQTSIRDLDLQQAASVCAGTPSVLTNILGAGLSRTNRGVVDTASMIKAMEDAAVEETSAAIKPINYLSIIAQIAPMLGLLGTVSGMIKAFQKIGQGAMGDPEILAADIGEAMVTTAAGLIIGIPAMFLYFYLKSRFNSTVSRMSRVLGNLMHDLDISLGSSADKDITVPSEAPTPTPAPTPQPGESL